MSEVNSKYYLVRKTKNKQAIANILGLIDTRLKTLIRHINQVKCSDQICNNIKLLAIRYQSLKLSENIYMEDTSFTLNKNETMLCLAARDKNEKIYDINKLMFVVLHEMGHVGSQSYGHNEEFVNLFTFLLEQSIDLGIYTYQDYKQRPEEYCGIYINQTPI